MSRFIFTSLINPITVVSSETPRKATNRFYIYIRAQFAEAQLKYIKDSSFSYTNYFRAKTYPSKSTITCCLYVKHIVVVVVINELCVRNACSGYCLSCGYSEAAIYIYGFVSKTEFAQIFAKANTAPHFATALNRAQQCV